MEARKAVYKGLDESEMTAIDGALKCHHVEYDKKLHWLIKGETLTDASAPVSVREFSFNLIGADWRTEHGSDSLEQVIKFIHAYYANNPPKQ